MYNWELRAQELKQRLLEEKLRIKKYEKRKIKKIREIEQELNFLLKELQTVLDPNIKEYKPRVVKHKQVNIPDHIFKDFIRQDRKTSIRNAICSKFSISKHTFYRLYKKWKLEQEENGLFLPQSGRDTLNMARDEAKFNV